MLDFLRYFDVFCEETGLRLTLTLEMPAGYDQANGLFDPEKNVVFFNVQRLASRPDYEQAFYFFHELRHAAPISPPGKFPGQHPPKPFLHSPIRRDLLQMDQWPLSEMQLRRQRSGISRSVPGPAL